MTSAALAPLAAGDPRRYMVLAGLLAVLVGGVQLLLGLLRGGVLVGFLSHSVLTGFTSAAEPSSRSNDGEPGRLK